MTTCRKMCGLLNRNPTGHRLQITPAVPRKRGMRGVSALGRPFVGAPADLESSLTEFRVFLPTVVSAAIPQASQMCHGPPRTVTVRPGIHAASCNRHQIERPRLAPASASLSCIAGAPSAVVQSARAQLSRPYLTTDGERRRGYARRYHRCWRDHNLVTSNLALHLPFISANSWKSSWLATLFRVPISSSVQPRSGFFPSPHSGRRYFRLNDWPEAAPCGG